MGFQFNHVGGGTKTRRPITLHMKYNSACVQPNCFLVTEDYGEQELTLEELQAGAADHRHQMPTGSTEHAVVLVASAINCNGAIQGCRCSGASLLFSPQI